MLLGLAVLGAVAFVGMAVSGTGPFGREPEAPPSNSWRYGSNPSLDAYWDECSSGDLTACDALYFASPVGTEYRDFGSTCGQTTSASYGNCAGGDYATYGDADWLDVLWDSCAGGDMVACDDLYWASGHGTEYEEFGSSCGQTETLQYGNCAVMGAEGYGTSEYLDEMWDACGEGDLVQCDSLYYAAPSGTEYEEFGSTCGGTTEPVDGTCDYRQYAHYGDNRYLDLLWEQCESGVLPTCDELFTMAAPDTDYMLMADTCADSREANGIADCINPDHDEYGSDPYLDELWDECAAGELASCSELQRTVTWGTGYWEFGITCGGTVDLGDYRNQCG